MRRWNRKNLFHYFGSEEVGWQRRLAAGRDRLLRPLLAVLSRLGVEPDHVTYASMFHFLAGAAVLPLFPETGAVLMLLSVILDGIDGPLARFGGGGEGPSGKLLDMFADHIGVAVVPPLAILYFDAEPVSAYLFGLFYILYIIFLVVTNRLGIANRFVLRVKYPYFALFVLSAFEGSDWLTPFHLLFGLYYLAGFLILFSRLLRHYREEEAAS